MKTLIFIMHIYIYKIVAAYNVKYV